MTLLTYGILPKFEDFVKEYDFHTSNRDYRITNCKITGDRIFTSAKELYDYLKWLVYKWNNICRDWDETNVIADEYGDLASSILSTLNFEWI